MGGRRCPSVPTSNFVDGDEGAISASNGAANISANFSAISASNGAANISANFSASNGLQQGGGHPESSGKEARSPAMRSVRQTLRSLPTISSKDRIADVVVSGLKG